MVVIPLLIYASMLKMLPKNLLTLWVLTAPITWLLMGMAGLIVVLLIGVNINPYKDMAIAFTGFITNLAILVSVLLNFRILTQPKASIPEPRPFLN